MPEDVIAEIIGQMFDVVLEAALALWNEIILWTYTSLLVWIQTDMIPLAAESMKLAFMALAQITTSLYEAVRQAWEEVRRFLIEALIEFEQSSLSSNRWVRRLTSILIKTLEADHPIVVKREAEEEINWDSLPSDVRAAWIRASQKNYKIDVIDTRDRELQAMSMTH